MYYSLPGSSVHGDSPAKNTGVGCHALLQGIFLTQGLNPGLPRCRQILHQSHQGSWLATFGALIGHRGGSLGRGDSPKEGGIVVHSKGIVYQGDEQSQACVSESHRRQTYKDSLPFIHSPC